MVGDTCWCRSWSGRCACVHVVRMTVCCSYWRDRSRSTDTTTICCCFGTFLFQFSHQDANLIVALAECVLQMANRITSIICEGVMDSMVR